MYTVFIGTVKPVLSSLSKKDKTKILMINGSLMKVKSIAECSTWSILQYFCPAFRENWSCKFLVFLSGRLRQVLLYINYRKGNVQQSIFFFGVHFPENSKYLSICLSAGLLENVKSDP